MILVSHANFHKLKFPSHIPRRKLIIIINHTILCSLIHHNHCLIKGKQEGNTKMNMEELNDHSGSHNKTKDVDVSDGWEERRE